MIASDASVSLKACIGRLLLTYVTLTAALYACGAAYSEWWCGLFYQVSRLIPADVGAVALDTHHTKGEAVFRLQAVTRIDLPVAQQRIPPGLGLESTTLQAYAQLHPILICSVLMAWPAGFGRRVVLGLVGVVGVVVATLLDIPFTLMGVAQISVEAVTDTHESWLGFYYRFLQQGGRQVLSLVIAIIVIALVQNTCKRTPRAIHQGKSTTKETLEEHDVVGVLGTELER